MKKWIALLLILCMGASLLACGKEQEQEEVFSAPLLTATEETTQPEESEQTGPVVGVSLPNSDDSFWKESAQAMKEHLEAQGYTMTALFACDDIDTQHRHIREMLINEVDCVVVAAIDSLSLLTPLDDLQNAGIPVVAYDRLLMNTDAVDGFVTYDYQTMGAQVAQSVIDQKQLDKAERAYTIELFMGAPEDHSALLFYNGVMEVLQPYLDSGALECPSGRLAFEDTCVVMNTMEDAQDACAERLRREYPERKLDICLAASDTIASGCRAALAEAGKTGDQWPMITGQGGDLGSVKALVNERQVVTVYKDPKAMGIAAADMAIQLLTGNVAQGDGTSSDNYMVQVPTVQMPWELITMENYRQLLVDTGIYEEKEFPAPTDPVAVPEETTETTQPAETTQPTETTT